VGKLWPPKLGKQALDILSGDRPMIVFTKCLSEEFLNHMNHM